MIKLRKGFISSYDKNERTARVCFPDNDNMVSDNIPIVEGCTLPLKVDEFVICLYDTANDGYILGRLHERVS